MSYYDELTKQCISRQLDAIIDSSYDGLWICDGEGRVMRINKASEEINGVTADQVLNRKMEDIVKEGIIDRSVTMEVLHTGSAVTMIQYLKSGKQVLVTGSPVFDEHGKISLVVVNDRDISELNYLRSELERTKAISREYHNELFQMYEAKGAFSDLIIRTDAMRRVFDTAIKVARVDSTVLIQGASGVGKGLFSSLIHKASARKNGPFIRVDCGAIPETLIESELFGYEAGAFTGAKSGGKPGRLEMAEGGTLFLDEIGELPLAVQVKLLRFLEDGEVLPIGGTRSHKIDARVIAATNRDLEEMVGEKTFRRDLFYRLNVVPIHIPPLRERTEAIPYLIHHFLEKFNTKCSADKVILPPAVDRLCRYPFPGNIRELANIIEQLVVLSPNRHIREEDLPLHVRDADARFHVMPASDGWDLRKATEGLEREMIVKALKSFGTQRKTSGPLGINQSTLARKMKKYGIRCDAIMHHDAKPN